MVTTGAKADAPWTAPGSEAGWKREAGRTMAMPTPVPDAEVPPVLGQTSEPSQGGGPDQQLPPPRSGLRRVLRYSPSSAVVGTAVAVVAVVVAGWLTHGLWANGPLPGDDAMAHLVRAEFGVRWLVPRGRVDGWQTRLGGGYEQYLFLGPGLSWAVGVVHWLSMGLVSMATAFRVVVISSFLGLPLAVAFLARSMGWGAGRLG